MVLFLLFFEGYSTHLVGGTMHYEYLGRDGGSNNFRYKVVFTIYRDCIRAEAEYDDEIKVCVYNQSDKKLRYSFDIEQDGVQRVDPVGNTDCPLIIDNVCLEKATYTQIISLPSSTEGYILKWERCCRNDQVNLPNESGRPKYGQTYIGYIPNTSYVNSSPYFAEVPVPFMCLNDTTEIRNYAVDPDGDSLVFRFIKPLTGAANDAPNDSINQTCKNNFNLNTVQYNNGYSEVNPFGNNGFAKIDPTNGLTTYMSRKEGNFAVAVEVREYRAGVLLSISILDLQILVFKCDPNQKPEFSQFRENFEIEAGEELCFVFAGLDKDPGDEVTIKPYGDIFTGANGFTGTRATMSERTGVNSVGSQFCWDTDCDHARDEPYVITLELIDDGCPSKFTNKNVYIKVNPFVSIVRILGESPVCIGQEYTYTADRGKPNSIFNWEVDGGVIISGQGSDEIVVKWNSDPGNIRLNEVSEFGCSGNYVNKAISMYDPVPSPRFNGKDTVCIENEELYSAEVMPNIASYVWMVKGGSIIGPANTKDVRVFWNQMGDGEISLVQISEDGCSSDTLTVDVFVMDLSAPTIIGPVSICPNNYNEYFVENPRSRSTYQWFYNDVLQTSSNSESVIIRFGNPSIDEIKVVEINRLGCVSDTGSLTVAVEYDLKSEVPKLLDEFCVNAENINYYVTNSISSTYEWMTGLGTILGENGSNIFVDWDTVGNGYVSVIEHAYDSVNNMVCISKEMVLPVIIHPKPETVGINGDFDVCQVPGLNGDYSVSGFANSTFNWTFNGDGSRVINQGSSAISYPYDITDNFSVRVIETSEYGCVGDPLDSVLYIRPKPTADLILGDPIVCFPNITNKTYILEGFSGSTYEWWISGGEFVSIDSNKIVVDWYNNQIGELSVLETSIYGCIGDTVKLDIWIDNPSISMDVVSVIAPPAKDDAVYVKWRLINGDRYNDQFLIQKRKAGSIDDFVTVGQVAGDIRSFIEIPVNTDSNAYEYRVVGKDLCGNDLFSDVHTNILLIGEQPEPYAAYLEFTDYLGWQNGVAIYEYYRMLEEKTPYEQYYLATESNNVYFENGLEHYTQCYRVKATELRGNEEISWSNEVCFNYEPVVFAPNAFTPNNVGPNDYYFVVAGSFKTINLAIFNRWGEKLFETQDINEGWDGTYNGANVPQGVFMYVLDYTSYDDTPYRQKGTITLIR